MMSSLLLALALEAGALSNFPRVAGGKISQPAVGVTLGGAPAVVVAAGEVLTALGADGRAVPGFPVALGAEEVASGAPAAADMDGDGRPEIAIVTASGKVFLWSGALLPGFPLSLGARTKAGASFADVDGDGHPELLVGDDLGRVHALKRTALEAKGWPASVGCAVTSSVSSSAFAGGRSFAFGCEDGRVHVLDGSRAERRGFPLVTHFSVTGAPAFADLDDDGSMDLVVASQDFSVYAVNAKGAALPGFPVASAYRLYEGPAVADLDGDGRLDVVFASADGMVHAVSAKGTSLPGFPVHAGNRLFGGAAIGDVDRDGALDVVAVSADGAVHAFSRTGKPLTGFPAPLGASDVGASPLLLDLSGDGTLSVFVGVPTGALHAVRAPRIGTVAAAAPWPSAARDPARTGRHGPNPPTYRDLKLGVGPESARERKAEPRVTDALRASWRGTWLDAASGYEAPAPRLEWLRNGKPVPALEGKRDLPAGTAHRGERWRFALNAPGGATTAESPEVLVLDSAPGAPAVALEPSTPTRAASIRAVVTRPAADPDGDGVTYRIEWLLDGLETGVSGEVFPGNRMRKGALLAARVVASDGELDGPPALTQARVGDSAPGKTTVAVEPLKATAVTPVRARIEQPATDPDGDPLVYHYRWTVDGQPRNLPLSTAELPAALFRKHQRVAVEARASDRQLEGPPATAEVTIRNTPPTAPRVAISPARPRRGDTLRAVVVAPAEDADRDPLSYGFTWHKNGAPVASTAGGRELAGALVERGDRFELTVGATDGEVQGPKATAEVVVGNTPPAPPRIAIEPARPLGGAPLRLVVLEPARDVDGDAVVLGIAWTRAGRPTGAANAETLPAKEFRKHERVRVTVTPRDSEDAGEAVAAEVEIADAPPEAPVVAFAPERPTVTAPLVVKIRTPAADPDGDAVKYRYRFLRDGTPVALPDGADGARAAPFWTSAFEVPASELAKGQRWDVEVQAGDGERFGPTARATTTIVNSPPPAPRIAFAPANPRRVDGIALALEQPPDADHDVLTYRYAWTRNGAAFEAPADQAQIPRGVARKGDRWSVAVVATDGEAEAPVARAEVTIADTAPGPTSVAVCDRPVPAGSDLDARLASASTDADGDAVSYRYEWRVNGEVLPTSSGRFHFSSPTRKHDLVKVIVRPWDGELAGPATSAECAIVNTPPDAPEVALEPAEPLSRTGVAVVLKRPSFDRDGDRVVYRYVWSRNGIGSPYSGASIPAAVLRHGEVWRVEVTPFDGEEEGERIVLSTTVRNTPPPTPTVLLGPAGASEAQPLVCDVRSPPKDVDDEVLALAYRWFRNDEPEAIADSGPAVPAGVVRRGERWRCESWASDGASQGAHASAELTIRNTPPTAPQVIVEPELPRRGDDLDCRIAVAAADVDGDAVSYTYAWWRNDRPAPAGADPAHVEASRIAKGERWRCAATPSDGTTPGPTGGGERSIANTPPGPARVRLQPAEARSGQPLRCDVTDKSEDLDGDAVRYRFSWKRNGAAQPFAESSTEVPARLVKAGDRWRCEVVPTDGTDDGPAGGTEELLVLPGLDEPAPGRSVEVRSGGPALR